jgi:hypothetical protein
MTSNSLVFKFNNVDNSNNSSTLPFGWKSFLVKFKEELNTTLGGFFYFGSFYSFTFENLSFSFSDDKKLDLFDKMREM